MIRAKKNAVALTAFFIILVGIGEFTDWLPLGRIWKNSKKSFVQDCRVNILSTPDLQKLSKKITDIDRYADFKQIAKSSYFRVGTLGKKSLYYKLNNTSLEFESITDLSLIKPYSFLEFLLEKGKLKILLNDKLFSAIPLGFEIEEKDKVDKHRLNSDSCLFLVRTQEAKGAVFFLPNINSTVLTAVEGMGIVAQSASDPLGSSLLLMGKDGLIRRLDAGPKGVNKSLVGTYSGRIDEVKYSAKAEALLVFDDSSDNLTVVDAKTGTRRGILPVKKGEDVRVLFGTEGAVIGDKLADLKTATIVEELEGFCPKSQFVIDFDNKKMYFSSCEESKDKAKQNPSFVSSYDLHEMKLESQVDLGEKSAGEAEKLSRTDEVKSIFLDDFGRLIVLTVPI